jgi:carboxyl-terminal processing protease
VTPNDLKAVLLATAFVVAAPPAFGELSEVPEAIHAALEAHVYDPGMLESSAYREIRHRTERLARDSRDPGQFVDSFNQLWQDGPFSHVRIQQADQDAESLARTLDALRVGGAGARLEWRDDIAILTVDTMMGLDTIEQIDLAYEQVATKRPRALVIDLRNNDGGAFAVKPLVGHLLVEPLDAGAFMSRRWAEAQPGLPTRGQVLAVAPWEGWSIASFWDDVQESALTRVRFAPIAPHYGGPVYVLVSRRTASAAELAADALKALGRTTLVGERTAGEMLSQKPYDLPGGLALFLPIADYFSLRKGRIEGHGLEPDVEVPAGEALDEALRQARGR